jgi:hypothetical protein
VNVSSPWPATTQSSSHQVPLPLTATPVFAADTLQADHLVIASDSPTSTTPGAPNDQQDVSTQQGQLLNQLRSDGLLPDLSGISVTVVGMQVISSRDHSEALRKRNEFWLDLCAAANALSCEIDLGGRNSGTPQRIATHPMRYARAAEALRRLPPHVDPSDRPTTLTPHSGRTQPDHHQTTDAASDKPMAYVVKEQRRTGREIALPAGATVSAIVLYMTWTFATSRSGSAGLLVAIAVTAAVILVGLVVTWVITARKGAPTHVLVWADNSSASLTEESDKPEKPDHNHAREVATAH